MASVARHGSRVAAEGPLRIHLRWMIRSDLPEVLEIESLCYPKSWTEDEFIDCLRQRTCIGMVAECNDKVVGFMLYDLQKTSVHVLNFSVAPYCNRRGVGRRMAQKLEEKINWGHSRRMRVQVEIRESNLAAQLFFRAMGYRASCVLRDFYDDTDEDAYLFMLKRRTNGAERKVEYGDGK